MTRIHKNILIAAAGLALVALSLYLAFQSGFAHERAVRKTVEAFGIRMQNVSLLEDNASSTMRSEYAEYVTPALLAEWQKDPEHAPGRQTSSPWPAEIQIDDLHRQGAGYVVNGRVTLMTSTGEAGEIPVILLVIPEGDTWSIAAYAEHQTQ